MRARWMILALGLIGCHASSATAPTSPATPVVVMHCVGSLAEYCQRAPGGCSTYDHSVALRRLHCTQSGAWSVRTHHCVGVYRSIAWREPLLGGGDEYFDGAGQLVAAYLDADHLAYCNGRGFSQTFGTIPTCPTQLITEDLCSGS